MKITETRNVYDSFDGYYGKGSVTVTAETDSGDVKSVSIYAGEPEDNTFYRDLGGAFNIGGLVKFAYEAGLRGEKLEYKLRCNGEDEE